jgi:hypothetical protein
MRLPVLVIGSGAVAVDALCGPDLRLPIARPAALSRKPWRKAIERFLDGDPVEAGGRRSGARAASAGRASVGRASAGRMSAGGASEERASEESASAGRASEERASVPSPAPRRGGSVGVLAPPGTGPAEVAWDLLNAAQHRRRGPHTMAAGVWPAEAGDRVLPFPEIGAPEGGARQDTASESGRVPCRPILKVERPHALVIIDDVADWPDPRGRIGMLVTQAASLGMQVWAGADGEASLIEALGPGMAAVLRDAGLLVDLRATPGSRAAGRA